MSVAAPARSAGDAADTGGSEKTERSQAEARDSVVVSAPIAVAGQRAPSAVGTASESSAAVGTASESKVKTQPFEPAAIAGSGADNPADQEVGLSAPLVQGPEQAAAELSHTFFDEGSSQAQYEEALDFEIPGMGRSRKALWVGVMMFAMSTVASAAYIAFYDRDASPTIAVGETGPLPMGDYRTDPGGAPRQVVEPSSTRERAPDPAGPGAAPNVESGAAPKPEVNRGPDGVVVAAESDATGATAEVGSPKSEAESSVAVMEQDAPAAQVKADVPAAEGTSEAAPAANANPRFESSSALSKLALAKLGRNRHRAARDLALQATAADPGNAEGWIVLGAARQGLRDRRGAREAYKVCAGLKSAKYSKECRRMLR